MANLPTLNVSLPPTLKDFVEECVAAGEYTSASDVVRDALRFLQREREGFEARRERLREALELGIRDAEEGRVRTYGSAREMSEDMAERRKTRRRTKSGKAA